MFCLVCVKVKRGERGCFRIVRGVREGCKTFPWLFNVYIDAVRKEVKMRMGGIGVRFLEGGKE